jgi:hypothetical protein
VHVSGWARVQVLRQHFQNTESEDLALPERVLRVLPTQAWAILTCKPCGGKHAVQNWKAWKAIYSVVVKDARSRVQPIRSMMPLSQLWILPWWLAVPSGAQIGLFQ